MWLATHLGWDHPSLVGEAAADEEMAAREGVQVAAVVVVTTITTTTTGDGEKISN